ncbi:hypothetical protein Rhow_001275 [Rhodococcus wratislaviensis]|uniref:Uncharacterized protein n=1 Tax=Rhodococcus wratislaviensis TaxID=44752 RepID=A0A402C3R3_RHOWR|nr:hypothetical protein Rhow_001275 [Rhodococcus wratislaviensis]
MFGDSTNTADGITVRSPASGTTDGDEPGSMLAAAVLAVPKSIPNSHDEDTVRSPKIHPAL